MMEEYTAGEEEVHLEPQAKTTPVAESKVQKEAQIPAHKEKKHKRVEKSRAEQAKEAEDNEGFISNEALLLMGKESEWKRVYCRKGVWYVHLTVY